MATILLNVLLTHSTMLFGNLQHQLQPYMEYSLYNDNIQCFSDQSNIIITLFISLCIVLYLYQYYKVQYNSIHAKLLNYRPDALTELNDAQHEIKALRSQIRVLNNTPTASSNNMPYSVTDTKLVAHIQYSNSEFDAIKAENHALRSQLQAFNQLSFIIPTPAEHCTSVDNSNTVVPTAAELNAYKTEVTALRSQLAVFNSLDWIKPVQSAPQATLQPYSVLDTKLIAQPHPSIAELNEYKNEVTALRSQIQALQAVDKSAELNDMKNELTRSQQLIADNNTQYKFLQEQLAEQIQCNTIVVQNNDTLNNRIAELQQSVEQHIEANKQLQIQFETMNTAQHNSLHSVETVTAQYEQQLQHTTQQLQFTQQQLSLLRYHTATKQQEYNELTTKYRHRCAYLMSCIDTLQKELYTTEQRIITETQQLTAEQTDLEQNHEYRIQQLTEQHECEIDELNRNYSTTIQQYKHQIVELQQKLADSIAESEHEIEFHNTRVKDLLAELDTYKQQTLQSPSTSIIQSPNTVTITPNKLYNEFMSPVQQIEVLSNTMPARTVKGTDDHAPRGKHRYQFSESYDDAGNPIDTDTVYSINVQSTPPSKQKLAHMSPTMEFDNVHSLKSILKQKDSVIAELRRRTMTPAKLLSDITGDMTVDLQLQSVSNMSALINSTIQDTTVDTVTTHHTDPDSENTHVVIDDMTSSRKNSEADTEIQQLKQLHDIELNNITTQLTQACDALASNVTAVETLRTQLDSTVAHNTVLKTQLNNLKQQHSTITQQLTTVQHQYDALQTDYTLQQQQCTEYELQITALGNRLNVSNGTDKQLQEQIKEMQTTIRQQANTIKLTQTQLDISNTAHTQVQQQCVNLNAVLRERDTTIKQHEQIQHDMLYQIDTLTEKCEALQIQLNHALHTESELKSVHTTDTTDHNTTVTLLKQQLYEHVNTIESLKQQYEALRESYDAQLDEHQLLMSRDRLLQQQYTEQLQTVELLQQQLHQLQPVSDIPAEIVTLRQQLTDTVNEYNTLHNAYEELEQHLEALQQHVEQLSTQQNDDTTQQQIEQLSNDKTQLIQQITELQQLHEQQATEYDSMLTKLSNNVIDMKQQHETELSTLTQQISEQYTSTTQTSHAQCHAIIECLTQSIEKLKSSQSTNAQAIELHDLIIYVQQQIVMLYNMLSVPSAKQCIDINALHHSISNTGELTTLLSHIVTAVQCELHACSST